jgi:hypothetical protein
MVNEETSTNSEDVSVEEAKKKNKQEAINKALRQKYEREMKIYEEQSNTILDEVRRKGVSVTTTDDKKKLPEMITDIHILFSRQLPEFVYEGVDTSKELEKELNATLDDKIKEAKNKKKDEDSDSSETTDDD